jgi:hypothetical protein
MPVTEGGKGRGERNNNNAALRRLTKLECQKEKGVKRKAKGGRDGRTKRQKAEECRNVRGAQFFDASVPLIVAGSVLPAIKGWKMAKRSGLR